MGDRYRNKGEFSDLVFITSMGSPVTRYSAEKQINIIKQEMNMVEEKKAKMREDCLKYWIQLILISSDTHLLQDVLKVEWTLRWYNN